MAFSAGVNLCCFLWDSLDRTGSFYSNVLLVARKHTGRHKHPITYDKAREIIPSPRE
jgi:hypothetical protein